MNQLKKHYIDSVKKFYQKQSVPNKIDKTRKNIAPVSKGNSKITSNDGFFIRFKKQDSNEK